VYIVLPIDAKQIIKGRVQCFSMQVVMNKCFLLDLEKTWRWSVLFIWEKYENHTQFNSENDI